MTEDEQRKREYHDSLEVLEAQLAFMKRHLHADIIKCDESGVMVQAIYLSPMEVYRHTEQYDISAYIQRRTMETTAYEEAREDNTNGSLCRH